MLSYNHANYIESSLLSVISQKEYLTDIEIVIIDDGSTDGTIKIINEVIDKYGEDVVIRPYFDEHRGITHISKNFLKLINLANFEYCCFIASDDVYVQGAFEEQLNIFEKFDMVQGVFSDGKNLTSSGEQSCIMGAIDKKVLSSGSVELMVDYLRNNIPSLFIQSCIVRSYFIKSYESFDSELIADDWVFNIKFFSELKNRSFTYKFIDKPVFIRNLHTSNTSRNIVSQYQRIRQVCEKYSDNAQRIKAQAFWYSFYIGFKNQEVKSLKVLIKAHFDSFSSVPYSFIEFIKLILNKILKR